MRRLLLLTIVPLVACHRDTSQKLAARESTAVAAAFQGSDPLVLRIPLTGGPARVVAWPNVDSTVWSSTDASPSPGRELGFDDEAGVIAMVDTKSRPLLIDLRMGKIEATTKEVMASPISLDGSTIYGVNAKGVVVRASQSGEWRFTGAEPSRGVFPLRDGSVLIWSDRGSESVLSRVRPPAAGVVDSVVMPTATLAAGTGVGDRLYFVASDQLVSIQTRTLQVATPIPLGGATTAIAVTPSGDRIYALTTVGSQSTLIAVDRYHGTIASRIPLGTKARGLRVDPIGRYILVRTSGDSVAVISIAWNRELGRVASGWRDDLPLVSPDGLIATLRGGDVRIERPEGTGKPRVIAGGGADFWFPFWWTGFRPRAVALDKPVTFDSVTGAGDSASSISAIPDTAKRPATPVRDTTPAATAKPAGFTVSFSTLISEARAQAQAAQIQVGGEGARVETVIRDGIPIYRVILGPYATCADAQRVGRESGRPFWVPEGKCGTPPSSDEPLAQ